MANLILDHFNPADCGLITEFIEQEPTLAALHDRFLEEYGHRYEAMPPRFANRHDPHRAFDPRKFEATLGIDVAHPTHPISQWAIARRMATTLRQPPYTTRDRMLLALAEVTHDYGEAVQGIDIPFGDKTRQNEADELAAWRVAVKKIGGGLTGLLLEEIEPILDGKHPTLSSVFDASETIGYVQTGLRAARYIFGEVAEFTPEQQAVLRSIATDVRGRQGPLVEEHRPTTPQLDLLIRCNNALWNACNIPSAAA